MTIWALATAAFTTAVTAQGELGRVQYATSCAQCHGPDGRGDGPLAAFMSVPTPDLTQIQRRNGGIFPFARV